MKNDIAERLAGLFPGRGLQGYVRWKVRTDPAYAAAAERLVPRDRPLVDLGCGVGLLAFYLREAGHVAPIIGIDFDERKIEAASVAAKRYRAIDFIAADVRAPLPPGHDVVMLDVLQYLAREEQQVVLRNIAAAIAPGGMVVIRQGIRDHSWRHRFSAVTDAIGRVIRWMKAERLTYPSRDEVAAPFATFAAEITPLWGRSPFNNYLFVFTRPPGDATSAAVRPQE